MAVRTTVDIPEPLHDLLRHQAAASGTSIRSLIVRAIEQVYKEPGNRKRLTGPILHRRGKLGPELPGDENPHELIFS